MGTGRSTASQAFWCAVLIGSAATSMPAAAVSQEEAEEPSLSAAERARTTSFVWLEGTDDILPKKTGSLQTELAKMDLPGKPTYYPDLGGALLPLPADEARQLFAELPKDRREALGPATIEPNAVVHGFGSDCDESSLPYTTQEEPWGIERVWGMPKPPDYTGAAAVWIVDSGIAKIYDGNELNVVSRRYCTSSDCPVADTDKRKKDKIGHGTMIAGIIGAKNNTVGVIGMAPNAPLNALRVFNRGDPTTNADRVLAAVKWLKDHSVSDVDKTTPSPGDVVNVSLGMDWNPLAGSVQRKIEKELTSLADLGYKISIAAGNVDVLDGQGYVQAISPARAGGYKSSTSNGVIMTASAIKEEKSIGVNPDNLFWEFSAFGNYTATLGGTVNRLPDFAEPGDKIASLWPGQELWECSGTSFAAAHLAGLMLRVTPAQKGTARDDPSAEVPGSVPISFDGSLLDWIGGN